MEPVTWQSRIFDPQRSLFLVGKKNPDVACENTEVQTVIYAKGALDFTKHPGRLTKVYRGHKLGSDQYTGTCRIQ